MASLTVGASIACNLASVANFRKSKCTDQREAEVKLVVRVC